ncbi:WhiB family transcriptional regulator [Cellulomonas sp. P5_E12]
MGDPGWISTSQADLREAKRRCRSCPVLGLCALAAAEGRPSAGVWAGQRFGPEGKPRRGPRAGVAIVRP